MLNAIFYLLKSGCRQRMIPHDSPSPPPTVAFHCYGWKKKDVFKRIHLELDKLCRAEVGKEPTPSALIVDSQTVATSSAGGQAAYDGNKKKKGRKRNVLADTLGLVWHISVNPANIPDLQGAIAVFNEAKSDENFKNVGIVMADASYRGEAVKAAATKNGREVNIVTGEKGKFVAVKRRGWSNEPTLGFTLPEDRTAITNEPLPAPNRRYTFE
jgi:putative transposase